MDCITPGKRVIFNPEQFIRFSIDEHGRRTGGSDFPVPLRLQGNARVTRKLQLCRVHASPIDSFRRSDLDDFAALVLPEPVAGAKNSERDSGQKGHSNQIVLATPNRIYQPRTTIFIQRRHSQAATTKDQFSTSATFTSPRTDEVKLNLVRCGQKCPQPSRNYTSTPAHGLAALPRFVYVPTKWVLGSICFTSPECKMPGGQPPSTIPQYHPNLGLGFGSVFFEGSTDSYLLKVTPSTTRNLVGNYSVGICLNYRSPALFKDMRTDVLNNPLRVAQGPISSYFNSIKSQRDFLKSFNRAILRRMSDCASSDINSVRTILLTNAGRERQQVISFSIFCRPQLSPQFHQTPGLLANFYSSTVLRTILEGLKPCPAEQLYQCGLHTWCVSSRRGVRMGGGVYGTRRFRAPGNVIWMDVACASAANPLTDLPIYLRDPIGIRRIATSSPPVHVDWCVLSSSIDLEKVSLFSRPATCRPTPFSNGFLNILKCRFYNCFNIESTFGNKPPEHMFVASMIVLEKKLMPSTYSSETPKAPPSSVEMFKLSSPPAGILYTLPSRQCVIAIHINRLVELDGSDILNEENELAHHFEVRICDALAYSPRIDAVAIALGLRAIDKQMEAVYMKMQISMPNSCLFYLEPLICFISMVEGGNSWNEIQPLTTCWELDGSQSNDIPCPYKCPQTSFIITEVILDHGADVDSFCLGDFRITAMARAIDWAVPASVEETLQWRSPEASYLLIFIQFRSDTIAVYFPSFYLSLLFPILTNSIPIPPNLQSLNPKFPLQHIDRQILHFQFPQLLHIRPCQRIMNAISFPSIIMQSCTHSGIGRSPWAEARDMLKKGILTPEAQHQPNKRRNMFSDIEVDPSKCIPFQVFVGSANAIECNYTIDGLYLLDLPLFASLFQISSSHDVHIVPPVVPASLVELPIYIVGIFSSLEI
ncbi:uncharacterized protein BDR25DRAFT_359679 [Lindgomyces ingoldianus]|uniref:Uncharacterized protein n=1 Tax=Lindgomyces ingoldianus TaxID=673940 RepID=A0ACB6QJK1_9PLEO|nr:uncharacterized protein BDR25DRAFT_359679 [Lindgomyces ingoldianus]KAF2466310.1 hypothetical protein BDR25DRAFT_359679 [Lindgomyces ingoldianus]